MEKLLLIICLTLSLIMANSVHAQNRLERQNSYYKYGNKVLEGAEISSFLKKNCPEAYDNYHNEKLKIGWGVCVPSMALVVGGAAMSFSGTKDAILLYSGIGLGVVGAIGILSSMVVLHRGYEIRRNTCSIFNNRCARYTSNTPILIDFKVCPQAVDLALSF